MKNILAFLSALIVASFCSAGAADTKTTSPVPLSALQAADDARITAMKNGDRVALQKIFSEELHYAHSTGEVDSKDSFIGKLTSGKTKYAVMDYEKRDFTLPAPDVALMTGRMHIRAISGENTTDSVLSFLAAWRLENGQWHFLAWQSCKLPAK